MTTTNESKIKQFISQIDNESLEKSKKATLKKPTAKKATPVTSAKAKTVAKPAATKTVKKKTTKAVAPTPKTKPTVAKKSTTSTVISRRVWPD